jgi:hypothetical protein
VSGTGQEAPEGLSGKITQCVREYAYIDEKQIHDLFIYNCIKVVRAKSNQPIARGSAPGRAVGDG